MNPKKQMYWYAGKKDNKTYTVVGLANVAFSPTSNIEDITDITYSPTSTTISLSILATNPGNYSYGCNFNVVVQDSAGALYYPTEQISLTTNDTTTNTSSIIRTSFVDRVFIIDGMEIALSFSITQRVTRNTIPTHNVSITITDPTSGIKYLDSYFVNIYTDIKGITTVEGLFNWLVKHLYDTNNRLYGQSYGAIYRGLYHTDLFIHLYNDTDPNGGIDITDQNYTVLIQSAA